MWLNAIPHPAEAPRHPADAPAHPTPKGQTKQLTSSSSGGHSALAWIWGPPSSPGRLSCRAATLEPWSRIPLRALATPSQVLVLMAVLIARPLSEESSLMNCHRTMTAWYHTLLHFSLWEDPFLLIFQRTLMPPCAIHLISFFTPVVGPRIFASQSTVQCPCFLGLLILFFHIFAALYSISPQSDHTQTIHQRTCH